LGRNLNGKAANNPELKKKSLGEKTWKQSTRGALKKNASRFGRFCSGHGSKKRPLTQAEILGRLGVSSGKYHDWVQRYELENGHNVQLPKEFWLQKAEKKAILSYHAQHPDEGYRRLAYMMLDENIAAVSPSSVYRTLN